MNHYDYSLTPNKYLVEDELDQLLVLLDRYRDSDLRNTTMLLLMVRCGFRPKELLNLMWGDINWVVGTVYIRTVKGGKPRNINLDLDLISRLQCLLIGEAEERVFRIGYNQFLNIWHEYRPVKKRLHSLRHTFAVNLYHASGRNLKLVQIALGHTNLVTTSIYLELEMNQEELGAALTKIALTQRSRANIQNKSGK